MKYEINRQAEKMEPNHITAEIIKQIIISSEKSIVQSIALIQELERRYPNIVRRTLNVNLITQQNAESNDDDQD